MNKFNPNIPVRYGIIAGLISMVVGFIFYLFYTTLFSNFWIATLSGVLMLAFVAFIGVWSGITYRRENGNVVSFAHAFLAVMLVFVINIGMSQVMEWMVPNVIDPEYPVQASKLLREKVSEQMEKMGAPDDQIEKALADMTPEKFNPGPVAIVKKLAATTGIYMVLSLIIAAFIKRNSTDLVRVENTN